MTPRRGLVWPLLLIIIGLVFLAANFGLTGPVSVVAIRSLPSSSDIENWLSVCPMTVPLPR